MEPTNIQQRSVPLLLKEPRPHCVLGSETGSGKSLAYLLPIFHDLLTRPRPESKFKTSTVVVTANKELCSQVLSAAALLSGGEESILWGASDRVSREVARNMEDAKEAQTPASPVSVSVSVLPGGLSSPQDFKPWRDASKTPPEDFASPPVHSDIVICTPAALAPLARDINSLELFLGVENLVVDECDMLLDGGYFRALKDILMAFRRKARLSERYDDVLPTRHVFVGATIPDMGLKSVDAFIKKRFPDAVWVSASGMHSARHGGLSAVRWEEVKGGDADRLQALVSLVDSGGLGPRTMVFVNTVNAAENTVEALR